MLNIISLFDLFIFDLDDTLIKTEKYHYIAWKKTLKKLLNNNDFDISFNFFISKFHSINKDSIKNYLINELNIEEFKFDNIIKEKSEIYLEILKENYYEIKMVNGVYELLELILKYNKKFIIVSNSFKSNIDFFSDIFPILKKSSKNYYREILQNKKPNPECYLKVIQDFPDEKNKIGFEDSITGIEALTQVKDIIPFFINDQSYFYYNYILKKYNVVNIKDFTELENKFIENKVINTMRLLSVDMVDLANSGHPGAPLGCAPTMFVLWCKIMNFNPENPLWINRDRFILSNGHACALLYSTLYLLGYDYNIDDLKNFRQLHSKTPGHPEFNQSLGIEVSTGPLGQGIANGVGMAIASKKMNLNNYVYVMCGDGCLMEGISYEAASLAGHLGLNNLILLYDDNGITIDGTTEITFTENTRDRFKALNWNILNVNNGDTDTEDIHQKILDAKNELNKPTIIFIKTTIGYGSINAGTSSTHGSPLGKEKTQKLKESFRFDRDKTFSIDNDVYKYFEKLKYQKKINYENLILVYDNNKNDNKNNNDNNNINLNGLDNINNNINLATRDSSSLCLNLITTNNDNIIVGSSDLGESNKTLIKGNYIMKDNFKPKYLHYGIREHGMMSIANGISTYGIIPIVSTFLVFISYSLCSIRMAALSKHHVIYILTHDSIFIGEDGPSHQPIESLTILRSIPNLLTLRPCDTNETIGAYKVAFENKNGPVALILSRQILPNIEYSSIKDINKGAYIVWNKYILEEDLNLIIVATGSEVSLAIEVAINLKEFENINIRVVSMPCNNLFDIQNSDYKENILPNKIKKLSLEAGSTLGWYKYVNFTYGINNFGESGSINDLKEYFGFTKNKIINYIKNII